ncbi:oxidoreductase [Ameyamaea chiangmaiensis NBRC 103196]|uniref:FAD-dependent oxidoreductase n=1 Tax=Ameyamaea chiangmaiensis TaxID=442969 RepID=A0A850P740_9PROT|nr:FAD-dependent oxidoreductase [Ameyamaea chiangmaiensis]MBS4074061.1 FAD-dependent oxidoreductase [Ameyamaea chiangmaiensis]NVN40435.1 FAD-dependent oxidoreductase [Ameyamaea chiangmaiensis]GBQ67395.1 oxidoreductase [Ameyamaea chiangmaiensis NBRC 103196]
MIRLTEIRLPLDHAPEALRAAVCARLGVAEGDVQAVQVFRRGYDARRRGAIEFVYTLDCRLPDEGEVLTRLAGNAKIGPTPDTTYRPVSSRGSEVAGAPGFVRPVVIGTGPCGFMAALILAQMGLRPIVLERGKPVRERTVDTFALWRRGELTPESNVQFGEGGAGTFSDGKLYSGVSDPRHYGRKLMDEFVRAGAPEEILTVSKPHIGTFRLVSMVEHIRASIEALGGEYRFGTRVEDFVIDQDVSGARRLTGLVLSDGTTLAATHAIMAVGHSARDTFEVLHARGVAMQAKPFSIGVRIEHPQSIIDAARFGPQAGHPALGAADYKLVHKASNGRGVYSFCMCPGGTVVAATSEVGQVVTNGMSQYSRAERNANAGIVVEVTPERDYPDGPLAGLAFQRHWERQAFVAGGGSYHAPAQRVGDFLAGRASTALGTVEPSYRPGVTPTDLSTCLPDFAVEAIREALPHFARSLNGFAMEDAVMTAVETRTSSPVRIPRGPDGQSVNTAGLYPAGEGAGYAGGILSAGIDGIRMAEAVTTALCGVEATL